MISYFYDFIIVILSVNFTHMIWRYTHSPAFEFGLLNMGRIISQLINPLLHTSQKKAHHHPFIHSNETKNSFFFVDLFIFNLKFTREK